MRDMLAERRRTVIGDDSSRGRAVDLAVSALTGTLLAIFLLASAMAGAAELTVDDLAADNEWLVGELAGMKRAYFLRYGKQPPPDIAEVVARLKIARRYSLATYMREVVLQPDGALPLLHAQLDEPGLNETGWGNTLKAISLIGHADSVEMVVELTRDDTPLVYQSAWVALMIMPKSEAGEARALEIVADTRLERHFHRLPALYLALAREERARPIAQAMLRIDDVGERASAVVMLAYLGEDVRQAAVEVLRDPEIRHGTDFEPLRGLAEIAGPDEMRALVPQPEQGGSAWHHELWRSTLLHDAPADEGERTLLCFNLLRSDLAFPPDVATSRAACWTSAGRIWCCGRYSSAATRSDPTFSRPHSDKGGA